MKSKLPLVFSVAALALSGCVKVEDKPSYAELVSIYNAELETLDRLEKKRAERVAEYEAQLQPQEDEALQALSSLLGSASEARREGASELPADPNAMLDQAIANAEQMEKSAAELLEAAAGQAGSRPPDRESIEALYSEEFKAKLAELDQQIAEQQARVDRARQARDAAEPK